MKLFYTIKEVAEQLNVEQSLLRFWEKEFDPLIKPNRSGKTRRYKEQDIEILRKIHYLVKVQGLTLAGAKKKMKENPDNVSFNEKIYKRLKKIREELVILRKSLTLPSEIESEDEIDLEDQ